MTMRNPEVHPPSGDASGVREIGVPMYERPRSPSGTFAIPTADAFASGAIVDETYRILERIGGGPVTVVRHAQDLRGGPDVAIKALRPTARGLVGAAERFLAEGRALARVRDPHVVEVRELGEWAGTPYFVMEHVRGIPLDEWLALREIRPPTLEEALALVDGICQGVEAIHTSGAAHYDLAAGNFLVGPGLRALVADLGGSHTYTDRRTGELRVARTPSTMAPEFARGRVTPPRGRERVDVYAVGVLAFRLLAGRYPFDDEDALETVAMHVSRPPPPPRSIQPDLPPALEPVLLSALEKDPARRTASLHELRAAFRTARRVAKRSA